MEDKKLPTYAVFDDYRYSQRIAVVVRWFLLSAWLFLLNYRSEFTPTLLILNGMGVALALLNGYVHLRIWKSRPITRPYVLALSAMDLIIITAGIGVTTRFGNTFFVFYYPALLGLSLVFSSRRLSFTVVTLVAQGLTNKKIAAKLVISENTARNHVSRILDKLGLTRRSEAATFAAQHGLLKEERPREG